MFATVDSFNRVAIDPILTRCAAGGLSPPRTLLALLAAYEVATTQQMIARVRRVLHSEPLRALADLADEHEVKSSRAREARGLTRRA